MTYLGLLWQLATTSYLVEYCWTPPTKREIRTGLVKLHLVHNESLTLRSQRLNRRLH